MATDIDSPNYRELAIFQKSRSRSPSKSDPSQSLDDPPQSPLMHCCDAVGVRRPWRRRRRSDCGEYAAGRGAGGAGSGGGDGVMRGGAGVRQSSDATAAASGATSAVAGETSRKGRPRQRRRRPFWGDGGRARSATPAGLGPADAPRRSGRPSREVGRCPLALRFPRNDVAPVPRRAYLGRGLRREAQGGPPWHRTQSHGVDVEEQNVSFQLSNACLYSEFRLGTALERSEQRVKVDSSPRRPDGSSSLSIFLVRRSDHHPATNPSRNCLLQSLAP